MKGLEISKAFWLEYGLPMLTESFPYLLPMISAGLVGPGSECFGYDDEISLDHDADPGFCIFLPGEELVDRRTEFLLERAYSRLPREFMGLERAAISPAGGNRRGVFRLSDFCRRITGLPSAPGSIQDFLSVPEYAIFEITDGELFHDGSGAFTAIRQAWLSPPRDVVLYRLCGLLFSMSQAGEYNYPRCLRRNETAAAHLAADEFVRAAAGAALCALNRPQPYYKWLFRTLRELPESSELAAVLEDILLSRSDENSISKASGMVLDILKNRELLPQSTVSLQPAAFLLRDRIPDTDLRNAAI